jgi:ATP-dependent RNA circularization protein (DNA/RNA ligase family)
MDNHFSKMAARVEPLLKGVEGLAFQGELMGPGIQGNRESFDEFKWFVYDIYDIKAGKYLAPLDRSEKCTSLGLTQVPIVEMFAKTPSTAQEALDRADSLSSIKHPVAEGLVYKLHSDPSITFKAISNRFLLKEVD